MFKKIGNASESRFPLAVFLSAQVRDQGPAPAQQIFPKIEAPLLSYQKLVPLWKFKSYGAKHIYITWRSF